MPPRLFDDPAYEEAKRLQGEEAERLQREEAERLQDIDTILARLESGIAVERKAMNALLDRLSSDAA